MILRIGVIVLSLLVGTFAENVAIENDRAKRQSPHYQYVNFELPNNTNQFQFAPPQPDPLQLAQYQNQFQNFNSRHVPDQFNTNSIRRFPQFPNAAPANEEPLISVLSGSNQFHPSQSVSWNPPPTIVPPQPRQPSAPLIARAPEPSPRLAPEPALPKPSFQLEDSGPNKRVNLQAGNTNLVADKTSTVASTTVSPATTPKDGKKDDVVIYYYYYYDDDKNKTDGLDTIPSLEGFDAPKAKPGKVIIKNDNFATAPKEATPQPIIPLRVDSRIPSVSVPQSPPQAAQPKLQDSFREITTERPTTQSARTTPMALDNHSLISNIFRYGSSSAVPNVPSVTSEPRPFTAEPSFSFEPTKLAEVPKVIPSDRSINKLPNFTPDKVEPELAIRDSNTTPLQALSPSTWRTTLSTTTTTTTTTTTPAPTTTTTTTTTTTPAPATEATDAQKRRFGHRRPGIGAGRPNPLNRVRSSTTTTTTTAAPTTERRSFTRPAPSLNSQRRPNRFRKRPGFGNSEPAEESNAEAAAPAAAASTSTTPAAPVLRTETSSYSPRSRFGGRGRFSANRQQSSASSAPQSQPRSTTTAAPPVSTESSNVASTTRRSFASRGRPQLRGGNRAPFGRNRTTKPPTEEVTPDPSEASTTAAEASSAPAVAAPATAPVAESSNDTATEAPASETSESAATEASSTEKPRGRQRPLFGARPRPSLFGRRGQPASQK